MKSFVAVRYVVFFLFATWSATVFAQSADTVLINGKIITVDDQFKTMQALAIQGGRIVATGGNDEIQKLKGPATRLIDLQGRTVIPGLIDNHAHYMRAAEYWHREVRLDGVTSRKLALDLMREKARESKPGEWVVWCLVAGRKSSLPTKREASPARNWMRLPRTIRLLCSFFIFASMPTPRRSRRWVLKRAPQTPPTSRSTRMLRGN